MKTEIVTTLKRRATKVLAELRETKEPVLITEHGKPSAYLVDAEAYEMMQARIEILEGIARGERAILENRLYSAAEAKQRMKKILSEHEVSKKLTSEQEEEINVIIKEAEAFYRKKEELK